MISLGTDNKGNPVNVDLRAEGNILIGGENKTEIMHIILEQCEQWGMNVFWVDKTNYDEETLYELLNKTIREIQRRINDSGENRRREDIVIGIVSMEDFMFADGGINGKLNEKLKRILPFTGEVGVYLLMGIDSPSRLPEMALEVRACTVCRIAGRIASERESSVFLNGKECASKLSPGEYVLRKRDICVFRLPLSVG